MINVIKYKGTACGSRPEAIENTEIVCDLENKENQIIYTGRFKNIEYKTNNIRADIELLKQIKTPEIRGRKFKGITPKLQISPRFSISLDKKYEDIVVKEKSLEDLWLLKSRLPDNIAILGKPCNDFYEDIVKYGCFYNPETNEVILDIPQEETELIVNGNLIKKIFNPIEEYMIQNKFYDDSCSTLTLFMKASNLMGEVTKDFG